MTNDEDQLLIDMLMGCRNNVARAKKDVDAAQSVLNTMVKQLTETEQAIIDYCTGNGVVQFATEHHSITLGSTESVDVPDIEGVPEEFIRTKITREPNKVLIKEVRPQGNWLTYKQSKHVTLRNK